MAVNIERVTAEMSSEEFFKYIDEGITQVSAWIEREKTSIGFIVNEESIAPLIKIYLSQKNLLLSSAREPEGRIRLIYQAIYDNFFPNRQHRNRTTGKPTIKPLLGKE